VKRQRKPSRRAANRLRELRVCAKKIVGALRRNLFGARRRAISLQFLQEVQVRGVVFCACD